MMSSIFRYLPLWIPPRAMSWFVLAFFVAMLLSVLFAPEPWPWRSAAMPVVMAGIAIVLALLETAVANVPALRERFAPKGVLDLGLSTDQSEETVRERASQAVLWLLLLVGGVIVVGFHVIVPVFLFLYVRVMARATWLRCVLYAAAGWFLIFVVLNALMEVHWPEPLLTW